MSLTVWARGCGDFQIEEGETLLDAGLRAGFGFPYACRNGNCERCLAILETGEVSHPTNTAERLRTRHGENAILCCKAYPLTSCRFNMNNLTAPGELPLVQKTCQKITLTPLGKDVSLLQLLLPAGQRIDWYAGQHASLRIDGRWLPFSIANAPTPGNRQLEFHFRHLPHHASAQHNLEWLQQHNLIRVRLPQGHCFLDQPPDRPIWFICGSTGFSQAQAMLQYLVNQVHAGEIRLFWGVRKKADLYLADAPARLAKRLPGFIYEQVLSDESLAGYPHGLPHEQALTHLENPDEPLFVLSGSPAMVESVHGTLLNTGVNDKQIISDMLPAKDSHPASH